VKVGTKHQKKSLALKKTYSENALMLYLCCSCPNATTIKLGNKELFDKEQICIKEPNASLLHKDKEHLALRNNFRVTEKFLIAKFDCT
jgi:hypothetical protein